MKWMLNIKEGLLNKIASSVILVATYASIGSCSFLFYEVEVPRELQVKQPFMRDE
ncbi:cyclic lactone autoinducer peptide [Planococcus maitriensis]|uniref:Cyclic lactone autoinducer peptide n=1 Tax=Planococcus maitriensis TaxID=221799 RepID=A0A365K3S0_9BACL|nr:cyclic lactone autoinducer peptide [Planococcus maitriensis]RAZ67293.1 hypothetical protein DP119_11040 [Planococcus maitriensis]